LRHAILESAGASGVELGIDDFDRLAKCLNVGVAEAATEYVRYRDGQLAAQRADVEFLAQAGELLTSSLDYQSTLTRLTRLIVPRLADWCAVHVEGHPLEAMPIAHVDAAKVAVLREIFQRSTEPYGFPEVPGTNKARLVEAIPEGLLEATATTPEHLALLRDIGSRSWIIVPLRIQSSMFGSIILARSDSGRRYGASDVLLAEELARRAAVAIDNARLYESSQEERSRVEAATRAKDEFVAMVSHELRTPLSAIVGWVRLLRSGSLSAERREHALEVIERNANAQSQLVADLLDISRAISGKIRVNPSQVDLSNIVEIAVEDARLALETKRIQIHTELDRERAVMRGDSDRLQQIVWNLLTNAIKFTSKGGEIRITLRRFDSDLLLVVQDTGMGINPEFLPHIFEHFRQSDSSTTRPHGGLGIGLSITKYLVDLHGGSIEAQSEGVGLGASFVVRLPVSPLVSATVGVPKMPVTTSPREALSLPQGLEGLRILVVEDEEDARELLGILLGMCGIEVHPVGSAREAMAALEKFQPDLIISDIGLPEQDGYALIRSIRSSASKERAAIPAIALTAFARNEDRAQALLAGFNLHMTKPVEPAALLGAVADLAGRLVRKSRDPS